MVEGRVNKPKTMHPVFFLVLLLLTFTIFLVPVRFKYHSSIVLLVCVIAITTIWAIPVLNGNLQGLEIPLGLQLMHDKVLLTIDSLSAFFIIVINITVLTGFLFARGYLAPYYTTKAPLRLSLHYTSYLWLYISMLLVVMLREGLSFLIAWEIMALSSFLLVIFDAEDRTIMKTGISYLIQMHAGMFFILTAFLIVDRSTGRMSFDALPLYFSDHSNLLVFVLFFIGFGIKAGFIPFHTWLPQAHPAAPSHVSGVMSGVMIKMGIYGIIRVLMSVQDNLLETGIIILSVSLVSGILGVMMAIVQHDLKRLLAYHSIENIGIIGIGIGTGVIGIATGNAVLGLLGLSGGLLHVLNHSLFKSLLFFSTGSVYQAAHTRNMEKLGGLMKNMPYTSLLFLTGSLSICGLPPFNGFISEYLIYLGMFKSLPYTGLYQSILILGSIVGLALIGGLAVFCFTKAFGIVFLGQPRSKNASEAREVGRDMIFPQFITIVFILSIGLASAYFVRPVFIIVYRSFNIPDISDVPFPTLISLSKISILSGLVIVTAVSLLLIRYIIMKKKPVKYGPTWGCGYAVTSPRQQYTASSFAYNYNHLAKPVLQTEKIMDEIKEGEIFPAKRKFEFRSHDVFQKALIDRPFGFLAGILKKIAVMQTGLIQHYILYAFIYLLLVFLLTCFHLI
jgi:formate hydrogenlyase subunit 3/multisubunit Na+/H+ antiporter MnhD subunit